MENMKIDSPLVCFVFCASFRMEDFASCEYIHISTYSLSLERDTPISPIFFSLSFVSVLCGWAF